jgi:YEATS family
VRTVRTTRPTASKRSSSTSTRHLKTPSRVCTDQGSPGSLPFCLVGTQLTQNPTTPTAFTKPPFTCTNEGWGEFEMTIDCYITEKQKQTVAHDLHFQSNIYDVTHPVSFKNPSQALQQILRETGPLPTDEKKKAGGSGKKPSQKYDLEKIADALENLEEDDLLRIIQIIQDNKTPETYIKSDVDGACSLPWSCLRTPFSAFPSTMGLSHPHVLHICIVFLFKKSFPRYPFLFSSVWATFLTFSWCRGTVDNLSEAGEFSIDLFTMNDTLTKALWDDLVSSSTPPMYWVTRRSDSCLRRRRA